MPGFRLIEWLQSNSLELELGEMNYVTSGTRTETVHKSNATDVVTTTHLEMRDQENLDEFDVVLVQKTALVTGEEACIKETTYVDHPVTMLEGAEILIDFDKNLRTNDLRIPNMVCEFSESETLPLLVDFLHRVVFKLPEYPIQ